jgi:hypothetical protein
MAVLPCTAEPPKFFRGSLIAEKVIPDFFSHGQQKPQLLSAFVCQPHKRLKVAVPPRTASIITAQE